MKGFKASGYTLIVLIIGLIWPASYLTATAGEMQPPDGGSEIAASIGSAFTYQGSMSFGSEPLTSTLDFQIHPFDDPLVGEQIVAPVVVNNVQIVEGLFTMLVDFGPGVLGGEAIWLEISVKPAASPDAFVKLSPRQRLSAAPIALSMPNVFTDPGANFVGVGRNFRISGNEVFGVRYSGGANEYGGMYVETLSPQGWPFYGFATNGSFRAWTYYNGTNGEWNLYNAGLRLTVSPGGGLRIRSQTVTDGLRIGQTGDDGIQIGYQEEDQTELLFPNYGLFIPSPGVSAYGVWPNTANASGNYALYTVDNIEAGNVGAASFTMMAKAAEGETLEPGDIVSVSAAGAPVPGGHSQTAVVRRAAGGAKLTNVIGVVKSRLVFENAPGKDEKSLQCVDGPANPGDYVRLVVYGITKVKVAPDSNIQSGQRLTAASQAGRARTLQTRQLDGMTVTEGAPVVGIALESQKAGEDMIEVFVSLK